MRTSTKLMEFTMCPQNRWNFQQRVFYCICNSWVWYFKSDSIDSFEWIAFFKDWSEILAYNNENIPAIHIFSKLLRFLSFQTCLLIATYRFSQSQTCLAVLDRTFLVLFLGSSVLWIHWCEPNCKIHFFELLLAIINPKNLSKVEHYIIDPASCKVMWFQIPIIVKLRKSHNLARGWNNTNIFYSAIQSTGCFRKIDTIRILCILGTCGNIPKLFMGKLSLITILIYVCQKKGGLGKHSYLVYALR